MNEQIIERLANIILKDLIKEGSSREVIEGRLKEALEASDANSPIGLARIIALDEYLRR